MIKVFLGIFRYNIILGIFSVFALMPAKLHSQDFKYFETEHFDAESDFGANSVNSFVLDSNECIWFATNKGLIFYDGDQFKNINPGNGNIFSYVASIDKVRDKMILGSNLNIRKTYLLDPYSLEISHTEDFLQLYPNRGYIRLDSPLLKTLKKDKGLSDKIGTACFENNYNTSGYCFIKLDELIYFNQSGLKKIKTGRQVVKHTFMLDDLFIIVMKSDLKCIGYRKGSLLGGINFYIESENRIRKLDLSNCQFKINGKDRFIVSGNMICEVDRYSNDSIIVRPLAIINSRCNISKISYERKSDIYIVSTYDNGFFIFRKKIFKNYYFTSSGASKTVLSELNNLYNVLPIDKDRILTTSGIINIKNGHTSTFNGFHDNIFLNKTKYFFLNHIRGFQLNYYDKNLKLVGTIFPSDSIPNVNPYAVSVDTGRKFNFIAFEKAIAVFKETPSSIRIIRLMQPKVKGKISDIEVCGDSIWISDEFSLYLYLIKSNLTICLKEFEIQNIRNIQKFGDAIWLFTYGQGWYKYSNQSMIRMFIDRKNYLLYAHYVHNDKSGNSWVFTNNGIFQFNTEDLLIYNKTLNTVFFRHFNIKHGLSINETNGGGNSPLITMQDTVALFCTLNGINSFNPDNIPLRNLANYQFKVWMDNQLLKNQQNEYRIDQKYRNLKIEIITPSLGGEGANNETEYFIIGESESWQKTLEGDMIIFGYMGPGKHILCLRYRDRPGYFRFHYETIVIYIVPKWYQTVYFYIVIGLLSVLLVILLVMARTRQLKKRNLALTAIVNRKTEEIVQKNEIILTNARNKAFLASAVIHDIVSPIHFLNRIIRNLDADIKQQSEISDTVHILKEETEKLSKHATEFIAFMKLEENHDHSKPESFNISDLVENEMKNFIRICGEKGIIVHSHLEDIIVFSNLYALKIILRNLIDNASKHCLVNGSLNLKIEKEGHIVLVIITNSSAPIPKDLLRDINDVLSSKSIKRNSHLGMGLLIIADQLLKIKGSVSINCTENETVSILKLENSQIH